MWLFNGSSGQSNGGSQVSVRTLLFKRTQVQGKKGIALNVLIFTGLLIGFALVFQNILEYQVSGYFELEDVAIGYHEFVDDPEAFRYLLGLGVFFIVASLVVRLKFKIMNPSFGLAISLFVIAKMTQYGLAMLGFMIPFLALLVLATICFLFFNKHHLKIKELHLIVPMLIIVVWTSLFNLTTIGSLYNKISYLNHFRLEGKHSTFSSISGICKNEAKFNWFKYGLLPVKEPCYFDRYMEEGEVLTNAKASLLAVYYGGAIDFSNFVNLGHQFSIENYSAKEAVFLYQAAYEALNKRYAMQESGRLKEIQKLFIDIEADRYKKSLNMPSEVFVEYIGEVNQEASGPLSESMLDSLNDQGEMQYGERKEEKAGAMDYNDLVRLKKAVYESGKSTLFSGEGNYKAPPEEFYLEVFEIPALFEKYVLKNG